MKKQKQGSGRGPVEQAVQYYLVRPRHLAGGGDPRYISEFLRASGWKDQSKTGVRLAFESPDRTVRVTYDPFNRPGGWTIQAKATPQQEAWQATLSSHVPAEIVAGITDALTRPRSAHAPNVWAPLHEQRWRTHHGEHVTAISPDGSAFLQFHQTGPGDVCWWAGAGTEHGMVWNATFTSTTPMHLVQAVSTALADPQPVMRPRGHVPLSNRIRTTSVSVLPSQLTAWQQARISAARTATWASNRPRKNTPAAGPYATAGSTHPRR
ncbi:DUF317 domain-containing protein [Streptomyces sp. NPDC056244]|uniref:DUF317 domain-containing protein n=1 Tax=Streptomyces sp. NPDC056244 TaxID=3345762 RepID=UPI0035E045AF